jgi:hypothetical protein
MTKRAALIAALIASSTASARPTITVGATVPFSASDLANAVRLRADSNARIQIDRDGSALIVSVDGQTRPVDLATVEDPHDAARIVALVVVAMAEPDTARAPTATPSMAIAPAPDEPREHTALFGDAQPITASRWTVRASVGGRAGEAYGTVTTGVAVGRLLGPDVQVLVGFDADERHRFGSANAYDSMHQNGVMFGRAGVELRHRWLGVELGATATRFTMCDSTATTISPYITGRAHLFALSRGRIYAEVGISQDRTSVEYTCMNITDWPILFTQETVQGSLGIEVPL